MEINKDQEIIYNFLFPFFKNNEPKLKSFCELWKPFNSSRKQILSNAGYPEKYLYFVLDGVQRVYYHDDEGREATLVFTYSPSFGGVLDSFMLNQDSKYFYETLTQSRFYRISRTDFFNFLQNSPELVILIQNGLAATVSGVLERLVELQCYSSEAKFRSLLQRSPHILSLVPHKYLANYLGIDPSNFSKFINKIKI